MNLDKFTNLSQQALQEARGIAQERGHQQLEPEHLLVALLRSPEGLVRPTLDKVGVDPALVTGEYELVLESRAAYYGPPQVLGTPVSITLSPERNPATATISF